MCTRTILLTAAVSFNLLDQYGTKPSPEEKAHRLAAFRGKAATSYFPASEIRPPPVRNKTYYLKWKQCNIRKKNDFIRKLVSILILNILYM